MKSRTLKNNRGFTLIEVLTTLLVVSLLLGMLLTGLTYVNEIRQTAAINQQAARTERYINLYFRKQILQSDVIYCKNNRVYLQDMENPTRYYNYYQIQANSKMLRRMKVHGTQANLLMGIGLGDSSQVADQVTEFSMRLEPDEQGKESFIRIRYCLEIEGKIVEREVKIKHGKKVEYIE